MPISMRIAGESWSDLGHGAFGSAGVSRVRWSHEPEVADIAIEPARLRSPSSRAARAFLALVLSVYLTTPASASAGPVEATPTLNWSGYGLAGSAFTGVTGTFNVPNPRHSVGCLEETAVWVGIDGMYNDDLLQAGIAESGFAQPTNRARTEWPTPGVPPILCGVPVQVYGWWEDLPSAPVRVNLPVQPGDSVTVSLFKMSPGWWALALHDLTAKRSFLFGPALRRTPNFGRVGGRGPGCPRPREGPSPVRHGGLPRPRRVRRRPQPGTLYLRVRPPLRGPGGRGGRYGPAPAYWLRGSIV